jgi:hypothetical protein
MTMMGPVTRVMPWIVIESDALPLLTATMLLGELSTGLNPSPARRVRLFWMLGDSLMGVFVMICTTSPGAARLMQSWSDVAQGVASGPLG